MMMYLQACLPSKDSDEPAHSLGTFLIASDAMFPHADKEDYDQTVQVGRLI